MTKKKFNFQKYAQDFPELAEHFGGEDEVRLKHHFDRHGYSELRGVHDPRMFATIEGVLLSDAGYAMIIGWCDRRVFEQVNFTLRIGYTIYEFDAPEICWYDRDDVNNVVGDTVQPSGYIALLKMGEPLTHIAPDVSVLINNLPFYEDQHVRFLSVDKFLNQALGAVATLADKPAGQTVENGRTLLPGFDEIWKKYLDQLSFVQVFENKPVARCAQSIIITLYRKFDMLLPQLAELAPFLTGSDAEVIIVGNDLQGYIPMVNQVTSFCMIHDISLRIFVCSDNSGFSQGNNYGAQQARGDTLIFMNPDVFPPEGAAEQAFAFLSEDPGEALHGAMLYYGDGMLMHSGMYSVSDIAANTKTGVSSNLLRVEHFGKGLSHRVEDSPEQLQEALADLREDVMLVSAALWKVSKAAFDDMGGLSTDYIFAYYEDADFCLRWRQAGRPIVLDQGSRWIHMEGVGKDMPPAVRSFMWLNRIHYSLQFQDSPLVVDSIADQALL